MNVMTIEKAYYIRRKLWFERGILLHIYCVDNEYYLSRSMSFLEKGNLKWIA